MKIIISIALIAVLNVFSFAQTGILIDDGVAKNIKNILKPTERGNENRLDAIIKFVENESGSKNVSISELPNSNIQIYDYKLSQAINLGLNIPWMTAAFKESKNSRLIIQEYSWYVDEYYDNATEPMGRKGISIRVFVAVKDFTTEVSSNILEFIAASAQISGYTTLFRVETRGITGSKVQQELAKINVGEFDVNAYGRTTVAIENIRSLLSDNTTVLTPLPVRINYNEFY